MVFEARLVDGMTDAEIRALFDRARDADYEEIAKDARELAKGLAGKPSQDSRVEASARLPKLRARLAQVHGIDFFGASGRETADGLLRGIEVQLRELDPAKQDESEMAPRANDIADLRGRTWVTR